MIEKVKKRKKEIKQDRKKEIKQDKKKEILYRKGEKNECSSSKRIFKTISFGR